MFTLKRRGGKETTLTGKDVILRYGDSMTIKKSDVSDDEKPVTIHAQNGAYVNVVIEKHYHAPGWLTPELVMEFLKALQGGKGNE